MDFIKVSIKSEVKRTDFFARNDPQNPKTTKDKN